MAIAARERAEELRRPSDELTRLHWDIPTENRIGRAAIDHAKAVQDLEAERQRRASFGDGDGDMVSEQQAAQRRFAKNSADLEFERQYAKAIEIMRENERKRHEIEEIAPWGEEFKTTPQEREAVEKQQQRPSLDRGRSR
jgi:hypothetical protein